jgi:uncharacterized membrane protein
MLDTINGLPVHPLVVHAVVVLLPLAALGTIAIAVRPRWRTPYGPLVVAAALVATILVPVSTSSGESLEEKVGDPGDHAELGDQLLWFALALLLASGALVVLQWHAERAEAADRASTTPGATSGTIGTTGGTTSGTTAPTVVAERAPAGLLTAAAVVAVVAAVACGVQVYRVGDSGARAAWGDAVAAR